MYLPVCEIKVGMLILKVGAIARLDKPVCHSPKSKQPYRPLVNFLSKFHPTSLPRQVSQPHHPSSRLGEGHMRLWRWQRPRPPQWSGCMLNTSPRLASPRLTSPHLTSLISPFSWPGWPLELRIEKVKFKKKKQTKNSWSKEHSYHSNQRIPWP
jgi:hypothetical protein